MARLQPMEEQEEVFGNYLDSLISTMKVLSDSEIGEFLKALTDGEKTSFNEKVEIIKDHIYNRNIIASDAAAITITDETVENNTRRALKISSDISTNMRAFISKLTSFFSNSNTNDEDAIIETNYGNLYNYIMSFTNEKIIQLPIDQFTKYHTWDAIKASKYKDGEFYYKLKDGGSPNNINDFIRYIHPENDFSSYYIKTKEIVYNKVTTREI